MNRVEAVGKNVEQAIENGLKELNTTRDKVTINIIETGGLFKKAKVILTIDEEDSDALNREENIKRLNELEEKGELDVDFSNLLNEDKSKIDLEENNDFKENENSNLNEASLNNDALNPENVEKDKEVLETVEDGCNNSNELSRGAQKVKEFSQQVLDKMGIDANIELSETKDNINLEIVGKQSYKIIGKRGDGLNAFQYLCSVVGSRFDRDCGRVYLDTCGYKAEREQELIKLARKLKYSAVRDEKPIKLEPMCALDRKTIHKALKDDDLVDTHSEGEEPRRYIVISPKKQEEIN